MCEPATEKELVPIHRRVSEGAEYAMVFVWLHVASGSFLSNSNILKKRTSW